MYQARDIQVVYQSCDVFEHICLSCVKGLFLFKFFLWFSYFSLLTFFLIEDRAIYLIISCWSKKNLWRIIVYTHLLSNNLFHRTYFILQRRLFLQNHHQSIICLTGHLPRYQRKMKNYNKIDKECYSNFRENKITIMHASKFMNKLMTQFKDEFLNRKGTITKTHMHTVCS